MGTCLSKKKGSSPSSPVPEVKNFENGVTMSKTKLEENEAQVNLKKEKNKKILEDKNELMVQKGPVRKEIFIIKHRKSHDFETKVEAAIEATTKGGFGVRTSSCTKEEVDAILIHCGKLSRNNSFGKKPMRSGSKKSFDFDQCESSNDTIYNDEEQKKINDGSGLCEGEEKQHQHRQRSRESSGASSRGSSSRRRTPSREREQCRSSSSRERRVSRSPGKRSSETTTPANGSNNSNAGSSSKPGKMVSVPATISSLTNGGGGGEFATTTSIRRITVRRNVGAPSPRSQSPARVNENSANASRVLSDDQQQQHPSLCRNSSRKAEQSLHRRNPMNEIDPNTLAHQHSTANNDCSRVQNRPKKEIEIQANQKPNVHVNGNIKKWTSCRVELDKGVSATCKTKVQQEEDAKAESSMTDNIVLMTVVPPEVDSLKPHTLTRSRSSRQSRDLNDHIPEVLSNPQQSYTSLLLQDIQNFHKKNNTPSVSLPACVTKACSILEAVAELNSSTTTSSKYPLTYHQSSRNVNNVVLSTNQYGKRVLGTKDPFVESEIVPSDDVMEPSFQKYVTFERGGSHSGVDTMEEEQESLGSNSLTISRGQQQHWSISSSSREPYSDDSKGCWTSSMKYSRELGSEKSTRLGREGVMMKP
ncbi:hypothetical protein RIF29_04625 [Crotalaria pallida]|uniref:Uncharacterized protein n=1 Tax=Crotalaria pallida TaxID=3830 RepID=A0AAN9J289_CROPI